jgi:hypothetical protein
MHDRRAGLGRGDGAFSDLLGRARHVRAAVLRPARAGHGTGDEDLAVHFERHDILRFGDGGDHPCLSRTIARLAGG